MRILSVQDYQRLQIESLVREQALLRFKKEVVFLAIYNENIVGFSSIHIYQPVINSLFVSPKFTWQGIGTRLLKTLEKIAIYKKHKFIYVTSSLTAKMSNRGYEIIRESGFYSE
ncbi:GNAT family N-acetyltransferase [Okeania sp.]|uniref:GNAT family N-acetyltransferase n=1 Tax=Okeania sp. TaxID=3100323 RepID=UPI002B4AC548|nr:GNAT family N-acetyltransferase [Okeania sp.]MEB3343608.1 GNAT family N-acetyltransferase [Okeania sp.]